MVRVRRVSCILVILEGAGWWRRLFVGGDQGWWWARIGGAVVAGPLDSRDGRGDRARCAHGLTLAEDLMVRLGRWAWVVSKAD